MIKELYPNKIEIINKGERSAIYNTNNTLVISDVKSPRVRVMAKGFGKSGPVIIDFKKDNLENIFVIATDINRENYIKEIGVCQIIDDIPYIIYKIPINMNEYIENEELASDYIKEIVEDGNNELAKYVKSYLGILRRYRITDIGYVDVKGKLSSDEHIKYSEISDKIMTLLKNKFPELSYDELFDLINSFDKLFDIIKDKNVDFILSKLL